ncbi:MAG TPA: hypothetical protein PLZ86_10120, partial [bacterium]|nr:hypothetical protein [bacterium]
SDLSAIFPHHRGGADRGAGVRALVTEKPEGTFIGPFSYSGRHRKDPNDRIPHQHRRELRGLSVFSAWLDNRLAVESRTADVFVGTEKDGSGHVVHYLFGFESSLGNHERALEGFEGYVHPSAQLSPIVMGLPNITLYSQREKPETRISHEAFDVESFEPLLWMPAVTNAAFSNSVTRDSLWASFILSRFTDDRISAIVSTAEFSDRPLSDEIAGILAGRRDKLLKTWLSTQSPLGDFEVKRAGSGFEVTGRDVAVDSNLPGTEGSVYMWRLRTINRKANLTEWAEAQRPSAFVDGKALNLMRQGRLHDLEIAAKRAGEDWPMHSVHVLVRKTGGGELEIAGITRRSAR